MYYAQILHDLRIDEEELKHYETELNRFTLKNRLIKPHLKLERPKRNKFHLTSNQKVEKIQIDRLKKLLQHTITDQSYKRIIKALRALKDAAEPHKFENVFSKVLKAEKKLIGVFPKVFKDLGLQGREITYFAKIVKKLEKEQDLGFVKLLGKRIVYLNSEDDDSSQEFASSEDPEDLEESESYGELILHSEEEEPLQSDSEEKEHPEKPKIKIPSPKNFSKQNLLKNPKKSEFLSSSERKSALGEPKEPEAKLLIRRVKKREKGLDELFFEHEIGPIQREIVKEKQKAKRKRNLSNARSKISGAVSINVNASPIKKKQLDELASKNLKLEVEVPRSTTANPELVGLNLDRMKKTSSMLNFNFQSVRIFF